MSAYHKSTNHTIMYMQQSFTLRNPQGGRPREDWPENNYSGDKYSGKPDQGEGIREVVRYEKILSKDKRVSASVWNVEIRVDIRVWENHHKCPTKKGVSLPLARWKTLINNLDMLSEALDKEERGELTEETSLHLGGGQYASVKPGYRHIDLRQFWIPDESSGELRPTRKGVTLKRAEWDKLLAVISEINASIPELATVETCLERDDHQNQSGL